MRATDEDRIVPADKRGNTPVIVTVMLAVLVGGWIYYVQQASLPVVPAKVSELFGKDMQANTVTVPSTTQPTASNSIPATKPAPTNDEPPTPEQQIASSEPVASPPADNALPPLEESDAQIKTDVGAITVEPVRELLAPLWLNDMLINRFVTFVNALAEGKLAVRSSPLARPKAAFTVSTAKPHVMTQVSQDRYNIYVKILAGTSPQQAVQLYRRYYPLLQKAYAELGERKTFHTVMLNAVDKLLAAPEPSQPPTLLPVDKAGLYRFENPTLEALPAAQKPLLRMGTGNARQVKDWLRQFRAALLTPSR